MDQVCTGLSLATGTKVTWLSYRDKMDSLVGHRSSVTKDYSNRINVLGWTLDPPEAVQAYARSRPRRFFREMIDYFADVTAPGVYIQTKALTASTLLDALTNHYSAQARFENAVADPAWKKLRPILLAAIDAEFSKVGLAAPSVGKIEGLRRYSFREKLEKLLAEKGIPKPDLGQLIQIRDHLVHTGQFRDGGSHTDAFHLLLWTSYSVLARLAGYKGSMSGPP
jgi:hypothetical protein